MKLHVEEIEQEIVKMLPLYYNTLKIVVNDGLDTVLENRKRNYVPIVEINEPMYFPNLYHKPIFKL